MKKLSQVCTGVQPRPFAVNLSRTPIWRKLFVAGSVGVALLLAGRCGTAFGQEIAVTAGEGLTIDQQEFELSGDPTDVSATGDAQVNAAQLLSDSGLGSGYLNISDSDGWVVQNLPVNSTLGNINTMFNLGTADGTDDTGSGVNLSADISANPVTSFAGSPATSFSSTLVANDDAQGEGAPVGNPAAPAANAISFTVGGLAALAYEANFPNVQAANNQCGPAALANDVAWLSANYSIYIPDPNVPGRGNAGNLYVPNGVGAETAGNSLVGRLDNAIGRVSTSRTSGGDTTGQTQIVGLMSYLSSARVNASSGIAITYQGNISGSAGGTVAGGTMTAYGMGGSVTAGFIYSNLVAGATVKLGETGHAVDVIGAGYVLGSSWVLLSSDLKQTDIDANDSQLGNTPIFAWLSNGTLYGDAGNPSTLNDIVMTVVPEPGTFALVALGFSGLALLRRRK